MYLLLLAAFSMLCLFGAWMVWMSSTPILTVMFMILGWIIGDYARFTYRAYRHKSQLPTYQSRDDLWRTEGRCPNCGDVFGHPGSCRND